MIKRQLDPARAAWQKPHQVVDALGLRRGQVVNAYHHFADGPAVLRHLTGALSPRGRVVNIDGDARETPVGPPVERRITPEAFLREARHAGLTLMSARRMLPHQYFLVLGRHRTSRATR